MDANTPSAAEHAERLGRREAVPLMTLTSLIWSAGSLLTTHVTTRLDAEGGLPLGEAEVLMATRVRGDLVTTPADLRTQFNLTSAGITKRIDQVEAKGLLERRPHPSDRRSVTLHLTADGERRADETIELVATIMADLADERLGPDEIEAISMGLSRFVETLRSRSG